MEKRELCSISQKKRKRLLRISAVFVALVCIVCTILPCSAFIDSPYDSDVYSMPLDFMFTVEDRNAGVLNYKLAGYLFTPLMETGGGAHNVYMDLITNSITNYSAFNRFYLASGISDSGDRLLSLYNFVVSTSQFQDYGEQNFELFANDTVISVGNEYVNLQTATGSPSYYNAFVSFDYKLVGDTTVHHYEKGVNSVNSVSLVPQSSQLGVDDGELVFVYNYYASVEYISDPNYSLEYYPMIAISAITNNQKHDNTVSFITENDRLIAENVPVQINNGWLLSSVVSFFDFEILPGFSLGGVMGIVLAIAIVIAVLKFVAGG